MLYIDLDGVVADFNKAISLEIWKLVSGQTPVGESKSLPRKIKKYRKLNGWQYVQHTEEDLKRREVKALLYAVAARPGFFSSLEPIENGLLDSVIQTRTQFQFLTAGIGPSSVEEKQQWCREVLGTAETCNVVVSNGSGKTTAQLKAEFCTGPDDILVDDNEKNVEAWIEAGGAAIHWTGPECLGPLLGLLSF